MSILQQVQNFVEGTFHIFQVKNFLLLLADLKKTEFLDEPIIP